MPHFYLHICNGNGFTEDCEGQELIDFAAARDAAVAGLRDIAAAEMLNGEINLGSFIEIEDENHEQLATVHFEEVVAVRNERGRRPA